MDIVRFGGIATFVFLLSACSWFADPDELLAKAEQAYADADYREARVRLQALLKQAPERAEAHYLLAKTYLATGEPAPALKELDTAEQLGFSREKLQIIHARALFAAGKPDAVIKRFPSAKELEAAGKGQALLLLGDAQARLRQWPSATRTYRAAAKVDEVALEAWLALGRMSLERSDTEAVHHYLRNAAEIAPENRKTQLLVGDLALAEGRPTEAKRAFSSILDAGYEERAATGLIRALLVEGDIDAAEREVKRLSEAFPQTFQSLFFRAVIAEGRGDYESAIKHANRVYQSRPNFVPGLLILGEAHLAQGYTAIAKQYLEQAYQLNPDNPQVRLQLAKASERAGEPERIIELLKPLPAGSAPSLQREALLSRAFLQTGDPDAADHLAVWIGERADKYPNARQLAANIHLALGQTAKARAQLQELISEQPDFVPAELMLARLDAMEGHKKRAHQRLSRVLEMHPDDVKTLTALARLELSSGEFEKAVAKLEIVRTRNPEALEPKLLLARTYLKAGKMEAAADIAAELERFTPKDEDATTVVADVAIARSDFKKARKTLEAALKEHPRASRLTFMLGRALLAQDDAEGAISAWERLLFENPNYLQARRALVSVNLKKRRYAEAEEHIRMLLRAGSADFGNRVLLGDVLKLQGKYKPAITVYNEVYAEKPDGRIAVKWYGALKATGDESAYRILESHLQRQPNDDRVRIVLAQDHQAAGRIERSIHEYEEVRARHPEQPLVLNNLAGLYHQTGDERALGLAEKAFERVPDSPEVADTLAQILIEKGRVERALPLLKRAWAARPENPQIGYHASLAYLEAGKPAKAKAILTELLSSDKAFASRKEAEALLADL